MALKAFSFEEEQLRTGSSDLVQGKEANSPGVESHPQELRY